MRRPINTPRRLAGTLLVALCCVIPAAAGAQLPGPPPLPPIRIDPLAFPTLLPTLGGAAVGAGAGYALGLLAAPEDFGLVMLGVLGSTAGASVDSWNGSGRRMPLGGHVLISATAGAAGGIVGCLLGGFPGAAVTGGPHSGAGCTLGFAAGLAYTTVLALKAIPGRLTSDRRSRR